MKDGEAGVDSLAEENAEGDTETTASVLPEGLGGNGTPGALTHGAESASASLALSGILVGKLARWFGKSEMPSPRTPQTTDENIWVLPVEDVISLAALAPETTPNGVIISLPEGSALEPLAKLIKRAGLAVTRQTTPSLIEAQQVVVPVALPGSKAAQALPELGIGAIWRKITRQNGTASDATIVPLGLAAPRNWDFAPDIGFPFDVPLAPVTMALGPNLAATTSVSLAVSAIEQTKDAAAANEPSIEPDDPFRLRAYRFGMGGLSFLAEPYLAWRARKGKEDPDRKEERFGRAGVARERGRYGWIHAASVGESVSMLPLIRKLLDLDSVDQLVITTGTMTSAEVMEARLPARAIHQYVPLDTKTYVETFIDYWRPEFAIFVESEIWPNMFTALDDRDIPTAIINGRMSERSFKKWQKLPDLITPILSTVDICIAQSDTYASRFSRLGAPNVANMGNVKFDNTPLPAVGGDLKRLKELTKDRPIWLAASTHPGEEEAIAEVHISMRETHPNLLTILVPRHPERGVEVATLLEDMWLSTARRSTGAEPRSAIDVYVADTIGELGLFYSLCPFAFLGGSLTEIGGHNPAEAASLNCAILHGPHIENFRDMYKIFGEAGATFRAADGDALIVEVARLTANPSAVEEMTKAGTRVLHQNYGSLDRSLQALMPLVNKRLGVDA